MPKCKKCGDEFEIPKNAIDMAYAFYCKPCVIKAVKKSLRLPVKEYIELQTRQLGL